MILNRNFSLERHGDGYALYHGRDIDHHGYRLCNINDFDITKDNTLKVIDTGLFALEYVLDYIDRKKMHDTHSAENELKILSEWVKYGLGIKDDQ